MKQYVYRRFSATIEEGYGSLSSDGISVAHATQLSAESDPFGTVAPAVRPWIARLRVYKQYALDDRAVALYCGYTDPRGDRGSILGHDLLADGLEEIGALAGRYPLVTPFFDEALRSGAVYESRPAAVDLNHPALSGRRWDAVMPLIQGLFGARPQLLEQLIQAVMTVARASLPEFIVVAFPEGSAPDFVSESGRMLMEALYACLPPVLIRRLGYLSFSCGCGNTSRFKVRFSTPSAIDLGGAASSYVCLFDLGSGRAQAPAHLPLEAGEYSRLAASLLLSGDADSLEKLRALRDAVDDECYLGSEDVAGDIDLHYAVLVRGTGLSPDERGRMILWQARALGDRAAGGALPRDWAALHAKVAALCLGGANLAAGERRAVFSNAIQLYGLDLALAEPYMAHYAELLHQDRLGDAGDLAEAGGAFSQELVKRQLLSPGWFEPYIRRTLGSLPFGSASIQRWQAYRRIAGDRGAQAAALDSLLLKAFEQAAGAHDLKELMALWRDGLEQIAKSAPALENRMRLFASRRLVDRLSPEEAAKLNPDERAEMVKLLTDLGAGDSPACRALELLGAIRRIAADGDLTGLMRRYFAMLGESKWARLMTRQALERFRRLQDDDPPERDLMIAIALMAYAKAGPRGVYVDVGAIKDDLCAQSDTRWIWRELAGYAKKALSAPALPPLMPGCYRVLTGKVTGDSVHPAERLWESAPLEEEPEPEAEPRLGLGLCLALVFSLGYLAAGGVALHLMNLF